MIHKYKQLSEEDVKILTQFLKPYELSKFDMVLNVVSTGESKTLERLEDEFGFYFNEKDKKLLVEILKRHGHKIKEVTLTLIK